MGRFHYGTNTLPVEIDDRTLAHLRIVIMNKLRRGEAFMFDVDMPDGSGQRSFWMHSSISMQFHFYGSRPPAINRAWLEELSITASLPPGLVVTPEPPDGPIGVAE